MPEQYDFKKEWEKAKVQLVKFSQEALQVAKKGEKGIVELSRVGKLHLDATALNLKREQLYYLIGKEYVGSQSSQKPTEKLTHLLEDFEKTEREHKALKRKIDQPKK